MHTAGKGNIYNIENPGIGKSNTLTFPLNRQGTLIPRPGYPLSQKTPRGPYGLYEYRIIKHYTIGVPPPCGTSKHYKSKEGGKRYLGHGFGRGYGFGKRVALAQNRAVGVTKEPVIKQEW